MAIHEQLITRVDPAVTGRLAAVAAGSNQTVSEIVRRIIENGIEAEENNAKRVAATREKMPKGITEDAVAVATHDLIRIINRSQTLMIPPSTLLSPMSLALYRLLSTVWTGDKISDDTRAKLGAKLANAVQEVAPPIPPPRNHKRRDAE